MYPMPEFQVTDPEAILAFMESHPLGLVATFGETGIEASHLPLLVHSAEPLVMRGHMMKRTSHWDALKANPQVFVALTGPDAPIPASWIGAQRYGGTWNYMAVHLHGAIEFLPDSELEPCLKALKEKYEDDADFIFDKLPRDYLDRLKPAIEAFEIKVEKVQAVFKLSQNRTPEERGRLIERLSEKGGEAALVAAQMS